MRSNKVSREQWDYIHEVEQVKYVAASDVAKECGKALTTIHYWASEYDTKMIRGKRLITLEDANEMLMRSWDNE